MTCGRGHYWCQDRTTGEYVCGRCGECYEWPEAVEPCHRCRLRPATGADLHCPRCRAEVAA